jgi:hypothetical protein
MSDQTMAAAPPWVWLLEGMIILAFLSLMIRRPRGDWPILHLR